MADGRYAPMLPPSPPPGLSHSLCFDSCDLTDQVGRMDASLFNGARCSIGQGVVLDGRDDFVELADAPQGGAMSLGMWLKLDTLTQADGGNRHQYLSAFYDGGQNDEIRLYFIKGGLRLAVWPEDKSPYCPAGNRGAPNPRRFTLSLSLSPTLTLAPTLTLPHPSPDS